MSLKVRRIGACRRRSPAWLTECMAIISEPGRRMSSGIREGPRRFGELRIDIPGLGEGAFPAIARAGRAWRHSTLGQADIAAVGWYSLTPLGEELIPALSAIDGSSSNVATSVNSAQ